MNDRAANSSDGSVALEKAATGIEGFDAITDGGIPRGRISLLMGGPGAGKTVFALQTLVNGAEREGEPGIFVAFEENTQRVVTNAGTFGWDLPRLEKERLVFLDAYVSPTVARSGEFDLTGVLEAIDVKAKAMDAKRIVFDGIDVLLSLLEDEATERRELFRIHEWLLELEYTAILTSKLEGSDPSAVRQYGFLQYMADCVIVLHHRLAERVSLRGIRVVKFRGSGFSENEFPFVVSPHGIEVFTYGETELAYQVTDEYVSSGIERMDTMLGGGYYRGSSILVTGGPGTAKTTLGGALAAEACERGEHVLYISFDEPGSQIVRNLCSVDIELEPYIESDVLTMHSVRSEAQSAEAHLVRVRTMIRDDKPAFIIIDPISALSKSGGRIAAVNASLRLLDFAKSQGITVLCTSLILDREGQGEATETRISTVADTWIHLTYVVRSGERNRALSIVKSRGAAHSNQVRELVLGDEGVTLADVYAAEGEVLMGTARAEKEAEERAERERLRVEAEVKRRELERAESETNARVGALQRELDSRRAALEILEADRKAREERWAQNQRRRLDLRGADAGKDRERSGVEE